MGDILSRNFFASSSSGEWGVFKCTLMKPPHLPHESVGGGAPLLLFLPLPLPCLPCSSPAEVGGFMSTDTIALGMASVGELAATHIVGLDWPRAAGS